MPLSDDFLKKFKLKNLPPREREAVESAVSRREKRDGERLNRSDPALLIQTYISRFREILDREDPAKRERGLEQLKTILHDQFLIKPEDISESFFDSIKRRHREEGHGDIDIPDDLKSELIQTAFSDQKQSLDAWIDYLSSDDAKYPDPLKYWTFRSILKMGRFDKEKHTFTNREGRGTVSPFPELNREALAVILEDMEKKYAGKTDFTFTARYDIGEPEKQAYRQAIEKENFAALYALAIDAFKPIAEDLLKVTEGQWRTYPKGSDPKSLVDSISSYGTGWCLRGEPTARRYLESNTLNIYYSNDKEGNPTVPRVVMVINAANQITEVRGIEKHEHLDSYIGDIVKEKLEEHPDGKKYQKKLADMACLTKLEKLIKSGVFDSREFTEKNKEEKKRMINFLYEVDSRIEGFGYENAGRDPRIAEIRSQRNPKDDLPILFGCHASQIALAPKEISPSIKAYIGKLEPGIFHLLHQYNIDHIYTSFPEGRIRRESLEIGMLTAKEFETKLDEKDARGNRRFQVSDWTRSMLHNKKEFMNPVNNRHRERNGNPETITLIRLRVRDLGFTSNPTTKELFARAKKYGLELCPPETGPIYRLSHPDQPMGDWFYVGMEPVTDSVGRPSVFDVNHDEGGPGLSDRWALPFDLWYLGYSFLFRVGKSDS